MRVVEIGDMRIAIGLDWDSVSVASAGGKTRSPGKAVGEVLASKKGVRYGIKIKNGAVINVGTVPAGHKMPKAPSGMALLAFAAQSAEENKDGQSLPSSQSINEANSILVENLGDGQYWVAIVLDGMPLPSGDIVASRSDVNGVLQEMMTSTAFTLNSPDDEIRNQFSSSAAQTTDRGFLKLIKAQDIRPSKGALSQVAGIPPVVVYALLFVLTLIAVWLGYYYLVKKGQDVAAEARRRAQLAEQARQEAQALTDYQASVYKAVLAALSEGRKDVDQVIATPTPSGLITGWGSGMLRQPHSIAGWKLTAVNCSMAAGVSPCTVSLSRTSDTTFRMLLTTRPDAELNGEQATYQFDAPTPPSRTAQWGSMRSAKAFNTGLVSDLQLLKRGSGVGFTLSAGTEVTKTIKMPPPPVGLVKAGAEAPPPAPPPVRMGVSTGSLALSGVGLWQLPSVARLLENPALSLVSMKFTPTGDGWDATWSMVLSYVIRTAPTPTLPAIILPDKTVLNVPLPDEYVAAPNQVEGTVQESGTPLDPRSPLPPAADGAPPVAPLEGSTPPPAPSPPPESSSTGAPGH